MRRVVLAGGGGELGSEVLTWLKKELRFTTSSWAVAITGGGGGGVGTGAVTGCGAAEVTEEDNDDDDDAEGTTALDVVEGDAGRAGEFLGGTAGGSVASSWRGTGPCGVDATRCAAREGESVPATATARRGAPCRRIVRSSSATQASRSSSDGAMNSHA